MAQALSQKEKAIVFLSMSNSLMIDWIHIAFAVPFAKAMYSASVLDFETVGCFLALHDIKFGSKKIL